MFLIDGAFLTSWGKEFQISALEYAIFLRNISTLDLGMYRFNFPAELKFLLWISLVNVK